MKFGFVTCVQFGLSCIENIYKIGGTIAVIITLHDRKFTRKSGRVYLDEFCKKHHVDLLKINSVDDEEVISAIKEHELDWLFIIGWGWIAGKEVLDTPLKGCIGWHPSALPVGRGRASIPWAIIKDLKETAVTLFKLDEGVDTGDIIKQIRIPITACETATTLSEKIINANKQLIQDAWAELNAGSYQLIKQAEETATFWPGRTPEDGELHNQMSVLEADRVIRATTRPFPGAYITSGTYKIIVFAARIMTQDDGIGPYLKFTDGFLNLLDFEINLKP